MNEAQRVSQEKICKTHRTCNEAWRGLADRGECLEQEPRAPSSSPAITHELIIRVHEKKRSGFVHSES